MMFTNERFAMNDSEKATVVLLGCAWKQNSVVAVLLIILERTAEGALHTEIRGPKVPLKSKLNIFRLIVYR